MIFVCIFIERNNLLVNATVSVEFENLNLLEFKTKFQFKNLRTKFEFFEGVIFLSFE